MIEQSALQPASSSRGQAGPSIVDDLFDLAAAHDLDVMLGKGLRMTTRILGAEAGSVLFQAQAPINIRSGAFRQEALARIQRWEQVIRKRLQESTWTIPSPTSLPISVSRLSDSNLALVSVPLLQGNKVVGSLSLVLSPGSEVAENQRSMLTRIAIGLGQLASLVSELEMANRRLHHISVFYDVGQALVTTFDISKLLAEAMKLATNVIDAGAASIMLLDEERRELVFKVSHSQRGQLMGLQRLPLDAGIAGWVARNGQPVIANDARADARFSHRVDVRTGFLTQSIAAVPLRVKGRTIGVLEVINKYSGSGFDQEDIQLMSAVAAQAAIAIENARLYQELRDDLEHIILAQDEVRRDLTRKLEDGPIQQLSAISMSLEHLERLNFSTNPEAVQNEIDAVRNLVHKANRAAHQMLFELRPIILETEGLIAALEQYVNQLQQFESFNIEFRSVEKVNFDLETAGAIYSIVQEAMNNIKRHAKANNVSLTLSIRQQLFIVIVQDNGQGFDIGQIDKADGKRASFGIGNMREQAQAIGAKLRIDSRTEAPNRGTVVELILPWPSKEEDTPTMFNPRMTHDV